MLREAYKIREGGYVILEPENGGIKISGVDDPEEVLQWIRARRARMRGVRARLGGLANVSLEEEFED